MGGGDEGEGVTFITLMLGRGAVFRGCPVTQQVNLPLSPGIP